VGYFAGSTGEVLGSSIGRVTMQAIQHPVGPATVDTESMGAHWRHVAMASVAKPSIEGHLRSAMSVVAEQVLALFTGSRSHLSHFRTAI
jgi:hypothetical protein